ncbi:MAG: hypothetical protein IT379_34670 [Deltaproteobacteria bacterium]|nr:hypothetical protein [Deltaproteobacteria bacterium]
MRRFWILRGVVCSRPRRHFSAAVAPVLAALVAAAPLSGCVSIAAGTTADVFVAASPGFDEFFELDTAEMAAAAAIVQLEGIRRLKPTHEDLLLQLVRAYVAFAFAFVEERMEAAAERGDTAEEEHQRRRAIQLYSRGRAVALYALRLQDDGLDEAMRGGEGPFVRWLREEFDDEEDAAILFWAGYAIGARININRDDVSAAVEFPYARALVQRSVELDERYYHAGGHVLLGSIYGEFGEAVGGNPALSRQHFERALQITRRRTLLVQLQYATTYAASQGNRQLFEQLLREVIDSRVDEPSSRLANRVAQRRAARYLRQIDERVLQ